MIGTQKTCTAPGAYGAKDWKNTKPRTTRHIVASTEAGPPRVIARDQGHIHSEVHINGINMKHASTVTPGRLVDNFLHGRDGQQVDVRQSSSPGEFPRRGPGTSTGGRGFDSVPDRRRSIAAIRRAKARPRVSIAGESLHEKNVTRKISGALSHPVK